MSEPVTVSLWRFSSHSGMSSPRTNNCLAYSNYSSSGIGPKERALSHGYFDTNAIVWTHFKVLTSSGGGSMEWMSCCFPGPLVFSWLAQVFLGSRVPVKRNVADQINWPIGRCNNTRRYIFLRMIVQALNRSFAVQKKKIWKLIWISLIKYQVESKHCGIFLLRENEG